MPFIRATLGAVGFILALAATLAGIAAMTTRAGIEPGNAKIVRLGKLDEKIAALAESADRPGPARVAYIGDSTVGSTEPEANLALRLQYTLNQQRGKIPPARVKSLAMAALSSVTFHFVIRDIIAARPDLVVWQTALTHTSAGWLKEITHHEFAGNMRIGDLAWVATAPIEELGLGVDDLLFYKLLLELDLREPWTWLVLAQSRVAKVREELDVWIGSTAEKRFRRSKGLQHWSVSMMLDGDRKRYGAELSTHHLGDGLTGLADDGIVLQLLDRSLALLHEAGIPVVVYLNPINVEWLDVLGIRDDAVLEQSVARHREVALAHGAVFVDLHDLLPNAGFSDEHGHFSVEGFDAPAAIVEQLLPPVSAALLEVRDRRARDRRARKAGAP